jgi:hypothetical protein
MCHGSVLAQLAVYLAYWNIKAHAVVAYPRLLGCTAMLGASTPCGALALPSVLLWELVFILVIGLIAAVLVVLVVAGLQE